jgi:hypothetical protein
VSFIAKNYALFLLNKKPFLSLSCLAASVSRVNVVDFEKVDPHDRVL